jgi:hypothetical protein
MTWQVRRRTAGSAPFSKATCQSTTRCAPIWLFSTKSRACVRALPNRRNTPHATHATHACHSLTLRPHDAPPRTQRTHATATRSTGWCSLATRPRATLRRQRRVRVLRGRAACDARCDACAEIAIRGTPVRTKRTSSLALPPYHPVLPSPPYHPVPPPRGRCVEPRGQRYA